MKNSYKIYQVDVFTDTKFSGNPASVVWQAGGLAKKDMQNIAREFNNSETVFIEANNNTLPRLRYFTPSQEINSCGHATIAAAYIYKQALGNLKKLKFLTNNGELEVENENNITYYSSNTFSFGKELTETNKRELIQILGLNSTDLYPNLPLQVISGTSTKLIIPLQSKEAIYKLKPDFSKLKEYSIQNNLPPIFLFSVEEGLKKSICHGRMFAPLIGINEDPVNGNSCIPMIAYLNGYNMVDSSFYNRTIRCYQGEAIQRKGVVLIKVKAENREIKKIQIGGEVLVVFSSQINMDSRC